MMELILWILFSPFVALFYLGKGIYLLFKKLAQGSWRKSKVSDDYIPDCEKKVAAHSYKIKLLNDLNFKIDFQFVTNSKSFYQTVAKRNYLYHDLRTLEANSFLRENAKKMVRNEYLYKKYYVGLVQQIEQKVHTPVNEIRKSGVPYEKFIEVEKSLFSKNIYNYKPTSITATVYSDYYSPKGRSHVSANWLYDADSYIKEYGKADTYSFSYKIDIDNEIEVDYESLAKTNSKYFKFNNVIYLNNNHQAVGFCDVKNIVIEGKVPLINETRYVNIKEVVFNCNHNKSIVESIIFSNFEKVTFNNNLFKDFVSLKEITLPECLTSIPEGCFENCTSLECVSIPKNVKSISENAFKNCSSLKEIYVQENCEISKNAFKGCKNVILISKDDLLGLSQAPIKFLYKYNDFYIYKSK